MIHLLWAAVASVAGLLYLVAETASGIHEEPASYATVVLWLVIPCLTVVGAMLYHKMKAVDAISYVASLKVGVATSFTSTMSLLAVWSLFVYIVEPDFFHLMQDYAGLKAAVAGHSPQRVVAEIQAAQAIFSSPSFLVVSTILPFVVSTLTSAITALATRRGATSI